VEIADDGTEEVVEEYTFDDPTMTALPPPDPTTRVVARTGVDE
jgi:hypothetical protein